jgi:hypothetical protein
MYRTYEMIRTAPLWLRGDAAGGRLLPAVFIHLPCSYSQPAPERVRAGPCPIAASESQLFSTDMFGMCRGIWYNWLSCARAK